MIWKNYLKSLSYGNNQDSVKIDVTKIRGLSYYTGYLVETNLNFKVTNATKVKQLILAVSHQEVVMII